MGGLGKKKKRRAQILSDKKGVFFVLAHDAVQGKAKGGKNDEMAPWCLCVQCQAMVEKSTFGREGSRSSPPSPLVKRDWFSR